MMNDLKPSEIRKVKTGEMLFMEGDIGAEMFIVRSGSFKVIKREGSKMTELGILKAGDLFGEMAVLGNYPRTATVIAVEFSQVAVISQQYLEVSLKQFPSWFVSILKALIERHKKNLDSKYTETLKNAIPTLLHLLLLLDASQGIPKTSLHQLSKECHIICGLAEKDFQKIIRVLSGHFWEINGDLGGEIVVVTDLLGVRTWLKWIENPSDILESKDFIKFEQMMALVC